MNYCLFFLQLKPLENAVMNQDLRPKQLLFSATVEKTKKHWNKHKKIEQKYLTLDIISQVIC